MKNKALFHRRLEYDYPYITHGKGIYLYDENNKKYIDAVGGAAVASLGHGIKEISERIASYIGKYSYLHASQFTTRTIEEYAEKLIKIAPFNLKKVYFVSGGSEATETAVKLAYQYHRARGGHKRDTIIFRYPSHHGSTMLAVSLSGKKSVRNIFSGLLSNFPFVPAPICYRCVYNLNPKKCGLKCARALEEKILQAGSRHVFAFIMEPVIGASAGVAIPPDGYLKKIRAICNKYHITLIHDEIMCGFGRTGKWFASQNWDVNPDIATISKGISGGLVPLAAVFCTDKIADTVKKKFGNFIHGFTFANNQFTTAVGNIVYDYMVKNHLLSNVRISGKYLLKKLHMLKNEFDIVDDVRGMGLFAGFDLVKDRESRLPFERDLHVAEFILQTAMAKGLNLYFSIGHADGKNGDAIIMAPPFTVSRKEIDDIISILTDTLRVAQHKLKRRDGR